MSKVIMDMANGVASLSDSLDMATDDYARAVSNADALRSTVTEAKADFISVSSEVIYEATILSRGKSGDGPLSGIAASNTAAMKAAHQHVVNSSPDCRKLRDEIDDLSNQHSSAEAATQQALQRMRSLRTRLEAESIVLAAIANVSK